MEYLGTTLRGDGQSDYELSRRMAIARADFRDVGPFGSDLGTEGADIQQLGGVQATLLFGVPHPDSSTKTKD